MSAFLAFEGQSLLFNLVDSPWLPVILEDDESATLSLLDVLLKSGDVQRFDVPLETMVPAILRQVLLPVFMRATGLPKDERDWADRFESGPEGENFIDAVTTYLNDNRPRFALFDTEEPFAQISAAALPDSDGAGGLTKLVTTRASGNNVPLFTAAVGDQHERMPPAEAALWLLHTHCWDYGGPKPNPSQGVGVAPLGKFGVVIPEGRNLFETLMLNIQFAKGGLAPDDLAHWEVPQREYLGRVTIEASPEHLVGLFTQQARSIRLIPDDSARPEAVVGAVVYPGVEYHNVPDHEPHSIWRWEAPKTKRGRGRNLPGRHPYDHGTWWGIQSLLALPDRLTSEHADGRARLARQLDMVVKLAQKGYVDWDFPLRVGIYGAKYSSPPGRCEGLIHDRIPVPIAELITEDTKPGKSAVAESAVQIRDLAKSLTSAWRHLRKAAGYRESNAGKSGRPQRQTFDPTDLLLDRVDPLARRLFTDLQRAKSDYAKVDAAMRRWERGLCRAALEIFEQLLAIVGRNAVTGRTLTEEIDGNRMQVEYNATRAERTVWAQIRKSLRRLDLEKKEPTDE